MSKNKLVAAGLVALFALTAYMAYSALGSLKEVEFDNSFDGDTDD